jgi:hypothetical protein
VRFVAVQKDLMFEVDTRAVASAKAKALVAAAARKL